MRILITFLIATLTGFTSIAQDITSNWQQSLRTELHKLDTSKNFGIWKQSIAKLEDLTKTYPNEWLLQYYTGWAYTQPSFQLQEQAESLTENAEPYVKKALQLQPENTETLTLMAYWLSARINASKARGIMLGSESRSYADKAIAADSSNPRAYLIKALVIFYTPTVFGGGKKRAEPIVQETTQRFAAFKPKTPLDPHWGNDICQQLAKEYK
ncbi:hypothetical protein SAMN05518672_11164 [Chitinophaga sp. CF118]|uniref:tetratricopeptide repeat protein n=1 Tax=Chitinophaga sp. CF118 TaxID=1884367 RepID=UPI0008EFBB73|nr:hypothetical protein [Chitinophaga sp. CF118]SFE85776.1 hypothetical protein SAMN05518672_11164 [Chitinophaga sp. CF118]